MNTILVPLDGSALAEQILPYVCALAPTLSARVRLLEVVSEPEQDSLLADSISSIYGVDELPKPYQNRWGRALEQARAYAEGYLAAQAGRFEEEGLDVDVEVRVGPPAEHIVEAAEQCSATLIALATHGYSGLRRWALGSVADRVVQAAPAPVFLVRGGMLAAALRAAEEHGSTMRAPGQAFAIRRILVPLDGSDLARQALPFAVELASCARANLALLQAVEPALEDYSNLLGQPIAQGARAPGKLYQPASYELNTIATGLRQQDLRITTTVAHGHAAETIVAEAARRAASVIVMATHGRGGLRRWAIGSVADKVLHATTTPLVLVRALNG